MTLSPAFEPFGPLFEASSRSSRATKALATMRAAKATAEAAYRQVRPKRLDWSPLDAPSAAPLAMIALAEAMVAGDEDKAAEATYDTFAKSITGRVAAMGATRVVASLLAQSSDPDRLILFATSHAREHGQGTFRGRIAAEFLDDIAAAHVANSGAFCVNLTVPWRWDRDEAVVDALANVVVTSIAAFISIDSEAYEDADGDMCEMAAMAEVIANMRASLMREAANA